MHVFTYMFSLVFLIDLRYSSLKIKKVFLRLVPGLSVNVWSFGLGDFFLMRCNFHKLSPMFLPQFFVKCLQVIFYFPSQIALKYDFSSSYAFISCLFSIFFFSFCSLFCVGCLHFYAIPWACETSLTLLDFFLPFSPKPNLGFQLMLVI